MSQASAPSADGAVAPGWAELAVIAGLMFGGVIGTYTVPYQINAFTAGLGLDEGRAGILATIHILGLAVTALLLAVRVHTLSWRALALAGAALAIVGQLLSAAFASFETLAIARALAGIGSGCLLALANAIIAATAQPEKNYGRIYALMAATVAIVLALMPRLIRIDAPIPLFVAHAVLFIGILPFSARVPRGARVRQQAETKGSIVRVQVLLLFAAMTLLFVSAGGAYSFSARAAGMLRLSDAILGTILGLSTVAGVLGATVTGWVGLRWGRRVPLALSGLITGASALAIVSANSVPVFVAGVIGYGAGSLFTMSYVQGLAASLDSTGRTAVAAGGYLLIAYAFGPAAFGLLVQTIPGGLGWLAIVACGVAGLIMVLIAPAGSGRQP